MSDRARILVVDDDRNSRTSLIGTLVDRGYEVIGAADGDIALELYASRAPDLVLTDLHMPGMDGGELIARIHAMPDPAPVIVTTGFGAVESVLEAFRHGAAEYLTKPLDPEQLLAVVERTLDGHRALEETRRLRFEANTGANRDALVGTSPLMEELVDAIDRAAPSRATVLILGESGTGKELVAGAIHRRGPRAAGPLVKVHCAALAESLLESELFGHEKGAFTGAVSRRAGRFELAHRGTLFLDEIGEISPTVQLKLLRVLQEQELERVGGNETIRVDVRVIAATNRDLAKLVAEGAFREDLYYRLAVLSIRTPALRDRPEDIPMLAQRFLSRHPDGRRKGLVGFTAEAMATLTRYPWPGNVRELENAIEHAIVMTNAGAEIVRAALPPEIAGAPPEPIPGRPMVPGATLAEIERHAIVATLEACDGSTSRAAQILGISARKIQYRLHEYSSAPRSGVDALGPANTADGSPTGE